MTCGSKISWDAEESVSNRTVLFLFCDDVLVRENCCLLSLLVLVLPGICMQCMGYDLGWLCLLWMVACVGWLWMGVIARLGFVQFLWI